MEKTFKKANSPNIYFLIALSKIENENVGLENNFGHFKLLF